MANRSTYVSAKQHTRIRFTPLTWSCKLQCVTPQSPAAQKSYLDLEVSPDRTQTPCCILPVLTAYDNDGVMDTSGGNKLLSATTYDSSYDYVRGHEWYVDGVEISSAWTEGTDYAITAATTSSYNGMLTVYKNLSAGEMVSLQYRGVFTDTRLAMNRVVVSDEMVLECVDAGDEAVSMAASPSIINYDPYHDGLLLHEYLVGQGIDHDYEYDGQEYEQTATLAILQGMTPLESVPNGYTLQWVDRSSGDVLDDSEDWITSIDGLSITFDLRCVDEAMLEAQLVNDDTGVVLCRAGVDLVWAATPVTVAQKSAADIGYNQETYYNEAIVSTNKGTIAYPEAFFDILWHYLAVGESTTDTSDDSSRVTCGYGQSLELAVDSIGMDKTSEDGGQFWLQVEASYKEVCSLLSDDDGEALTDDDGELLIA